MPHLGDLVTAAKWISDCPPLKHSRASYRERMIIALFEVLGHDFLRSYLFFG